MGRFISQAVVFFAVTLCASAVPDGMWNGKPWEKEKLEEGVKKGDPEALAEWACWSRMSWGGVAPDEQKIFEYAERAAKKGNAYGQALLARSYLAGQGVKQDGEKGLNYALQAAKAGHPLGIKNLAIAHFNGAAHLRVDTKKGVALTIEAAEKGCVHAKENWMKSYYYGTNGITKDREEGLKRAVEICLEDQGLEAASTISFFYYYEDKNHPLLTEKVLEAAWGRMGVAADSMNRIAMANLATHLCKSGRPNEGIPLALKAAQTRELHPTTVVYDLAHATHYARKMGSIGDFSTVLQLSRDAYEAGSTSTIVLRSVADSYLYPWAGHPAEPAKAEPIVRLLLKQNYKSAHEQLGRIYYSRNASKLHDKRRGVAHLEYSSVGEGPSHRTYEDAEHFQSLVILGEAYIYGPEEDRDYVKGYAVTAIAEERASEVRKPKVSRILKEAKKHLSPEQLEEAEELIGNDYPIADRYRKEAFKILKEYKDLAPGEKFRPLPKK